MVIFEKNNCCCFGVGRFLMVLRALFKPPQSTDVQKTVAPLLDAEEDVLREKAAAVLGKVSVADVRNSVNLRSNVAIDALVLNSVFFFFNVFSSVEIVFSFWTCSLMHGAQQQRHT